MGAAFIVDNTAEGRVCYEQTEGGEPLTPWEAATLARLLLAAAAESGTFGECRGCHAPIFWAEDAKGNRRPLDIGDHPGGNVAAVNRDGKVVIRYLTQAEPLRPGDGERRVMPHHATCPERGQFRSRTG